MTHWVTPHGSTKYAVVRLGTRYSVFAVHAIHPTAPTLLASEQVPVGTSHGYRKPALVALESVMWMCQTTEAAWKEKRVLEDEDREAAQRVGEDA